MGHSRGGNLLDPAVIDTPALPSEVTHCEVIRNTLFIDWRGRVLICDHDLHAEYSLGDLLTEPLSVIQVRRQKLIDNGVHFKMCQACNDVLKMGTDLFADKRSGTLRDWIYDVYREDPNEAHLSAATNQQRWLYKLYEKEGRLARMVNGLLKRIRQLEAISAEQDERAMLIHRLNLAASQREETIASLNTDAHKREATIVQLNEHAHQLARRIQELHDLALEREQRVLLLEAETVRRKQLWNWHLMRYESMLRRVFGLTAQRPARPTQIADR